MMTISIGIPTYNRPTYLLKTIEAVITQNHPAVCEIIVWDQTVEENKPNNFRNTIQHYAKNNNLKYYSSNTPNLPLARNSIISKANGDIILWLDDDVILANNFINEHHSCFSKSISGGKIMGVAGAVNHRRFDIDDSFIEKITLDNYPRYTRPHYKQLKAETPWLHPMLGGNSSVLKNYAVQIGGSDENMIGNALYEDADFTSRLRKHFKQPQISYNPKAMLIHLRAPTGGCRINAHKKLPLYSVTLSTHIYLFRHVPLEKSLSFFYKSLRLGPLRKENILSPKLFISAIFAFFKSLFLAFTLRNKMSSIFLREK